MRTWRSLSSCVVGPLWLERFQSRVRLRSVTSLACWRCHNCRATLQKGTRPFWPHAGHQGCSSGSTVAGRRLKKRWSWGVGQRPSLMAALFREGSSYARVQNKDDWWLHDILESTTQQPQTIRLICIWLILSLLWCVSFFNNVGSWAWTANWLPRLMTWSRPTDKFPIRRTICVTPTSASIIVTTTVLKHINWLRYPLVQHIAFTVSSGCQDPCMLWLPVRCTCWQQTFKMTTFWPQGPAVQIQRAIQWSWSFYWRVGNLQKKGRSALPSMLFAKPWGVEFDLSSSGESILRIQNTEQRIQDLKALINATLDAGHWESNQRLCGVGSWGLRTPICMAAWAPCYTSNCLSMRMGVARSYLLNLVTSLTVMMHRLCNGRPREVSAKPLVEWFVYCDAAYEPETKTGGLGAVLCNNLGECVAWFVSLWTRDTCVVFGAEQGSIQSFMSWNFVRPVLALDFWAQCHARWPTSLLWSNDEWDFLWYLALERVLWLRGWWNII